MPIKNYAGRVTSSTKKKGNEMANIGATTAFYKVETSLTRANSEVSKSMERLATGKQNANARPIFICCDGRYISTRFCGNESGYQGCIGDDGLS